MKEIIEKIRKVNKKNQFLLIDEKSSIKLVKNKIELIHTELAEATEALRTRDDDNFVEELADVCIRIFSLIGFSSYNIEIIEYMSPPFIFDHKGFDDRVVLANIIGEIRTVVGHAKHYWEQDMVTTAVYMLGIVFHTFLLLVHDLGYDLLKVIEKKTNKNAKRGKRHGDKEF